MIEETTQCVRRIGLFNWSHLIIVKVCSNKHSSTYHI